MVVIDIEHQARTWQTLGYKRSLDGQLGKLSLMNGKATDLPLNPLRTFAVASRHKSFTDAAREMGVTQVAVSRQIAILEDYLGVQLFERAARSVKLSEQGRSFGHEIAPIFDSLEAATMRMLERERQKCISVRIYPTLVHYWLFPNLGGFTETFPDFEVRLDTTVEPLDFRGTHLDVAIQLGNGHWKDAKARRLFPERLDVVCSPTYARKISTVGPDGAMPRPTLIHSRYRRRAWNDWLDMSGTQIEPDRELEYETSLLAYSAAIAGIGLAVGQIDILDNELRTGSLVRPFDCAQVSGAAFHLVWPTTKSVSTQTKHFIDWLLTLCGQTPEFFRRDPRD